MLVKTLLVLLLFFILFILQIYTLKIAYDFLYILVQYILYLRYSYRAIRG